MMSAIVMQIYQITDIQTEALMKHVVYYIQ